MVFDIVVVIALFFWLIAYWPVFAFVDTMYFKLEQYRETDRENHIVEIWRRWIYFGGIGIWIIILMSRGLFECLK